jgi:biopolymer transport protein ExbB
MREPRVDRTLNQRRGRLAVDAYRAVGVAVIVAGLALVARAQPQPGDAAAAAPAAESPAGAPDTEPIEQKTFLSWMLEANGLLFGPLLLALSISMVALLTLNILQLRRENFIPSEFVNQFEGHLKEKRYQEAYDAARADPSFLARVLAAGLAKISGGYSPAIEAMQEVGEKENMTHEHRLSYLALIGTVSPMVGLMGTVYGMIDSFRVIASRPTTPSPSELAAGISTALFTTLEGLAIAIPAIAAYSILRNHIARMSLEVGIVSEGLMGRFSKVGPKSERETGKA